MHVDALTGEVGDLLAAAPKHVWVPPFEADHARAGLSKREQQLVDLFLRSWKQLDCLDGPAGKVRVERARRAHQACLQVEQACWEGRTEWPASCDTCARACMCVRAVHARTRVRLCMQVHVCMSVCTHAYAQWNMRTCICQHLRARVPAWPMKTLAQAHAHINTHTNTQTAPRTWERVWKPLCLPTYTMRACGPTSLKMSSDTSLQRSTQSGHQQA